jgi:hypothetical protein
VQNLFCSPIGVPVILRSKRPLHSLKQKNRR